MHTSHDARFWVCVAAVVIYYGVQPVARWRERQIPWVPGGTTFCWEWSAEDGTHDLCCRRPDGVWVDRARAPCDGLHPGHGAAESTR